MLDLFEELEPIRERMFKYASQNPEVGYFKNDWFDATPDSYRYEWISEDEMPLVREH